MTGLWPKWFENEAEQLQSDLNAGIISYKQYESGMDSLTEDLYQMDAEPLGVDPYIGY